MSLTACAETATQETTKIATATVVSTATPVQAQDFTPQPTSTSVPTVTPSPIASPTPTSVPTSTTYHADPHPYSRPNTYMRRHWLPPPMACSHSTSPILMYHYISEPPAGAHQYRVGNSLAPGNLRRPSRLLAGRGLHNHSSQGSHFPSGDRPPGPAREAHRPHLR